MNQSCYLNTRTSQPVKCKLSHGVLSMNTMRPLIFPGRSGCRRYNMARVPANNNSFFLLTLILHKNKSNWTYFHLCRWKTSLFTGFCSFAQYSKLTHRRLFLYKESHWVVNTSNEGMLTSGLVRRNVDERSSQPPYRWLNEMAVLKWVLKSGLSMDC